MGLDARTEFADPRFVDQENHDYRLKPDSPALALGFQEIDTSQIGLKEDFPYKETATTIDPLPRLGQPW